VEAPRDECGAAASAYTRSPSDLGEVVGGVTCADP
jgi:hypothetical protein